MRDTFVRTLLELAKENKDIELITGDLGFGVLKRFWEECPDQFTNAGIAEQNMTSIAAGMALSGKTVFTYSIGNFPTLRCLEQIRNDCAYHNANVKVVCVGGGFSYGSLGISHHATEDISILRSLPNIQIFAPGDIYETIQVIKNVANSNGTAYIRLGRGGEKNIHKNYLDFKIGDALKVEEGENIAFFSTGGILNEVCEAKKLLLNNGINAAIFSFPTVKPLDLSLIQKVAENYSTIVTVEENVLNGGFGSAILEAVNTVCSKHPRILRIGLGDEFVHIVGSQQYLREQTSIDAKGIYSKVLSFYEK